MGYTHYWRKPSQTNAGEWSAFQADCQKIIEHAGSAGIPLTGCGLGPVPIINEDKIWFNGEGYDSHETFAITKSEGGFSFCKTARKPYDPVVNACLIALGKHVTGADISSDGYVSEWEAGSALYRDAVGEEGEIPFS